MTTSSVALGSFEGPAKYMLAGGAVGALTGTVVGWAHHRSRSASQVICAVVRTGRSRDVGAGREAPSHHGEALRRLTSTIPHPTRMAAARNAPVSDSPSTRWPNATPNNGAANENTASRPPR